MTTESRPFGQRYAFVAAGVAFFALLVGAGLRATPGVLLTPWTVGMGWSRSAVSAAAAIGIFIYGLMGPFVAALMQRFGVRRTLVCAFALMAVSTGISAMMTSAWQLVATWGVLSGVASGCVAMTTGAVVVNRWFAKDRGLMMGVLAASAATGSLVFLPALAALSEHFGWRTVVLTVSAAAALMIPVIVGLLPERPSDAGLVPWGASPGGLPVQSGGSRGAISAAFDVLARAIRKRDFWLLFLTFFVCGLTTNGLVGVHLIAFCGDHGIPAVRAAGLLAAMGLFDLFGTTASGWLTDRFDPRKLLCAYYLIRGLSLIYLPYCDFSLTSLSLFTVLYGLDWIATVPPTVRLANQAFGETEGPIAFGWIFAGHQIGAASVALLAGVLREVQGQYTTAFILAGITGLIAAGLALGIARPSAPAPRVA